jgi:DNA-directed RNA polymerase specialized sigma24 family protein
LPAVPGQDAEDVIQEVFLTVSEGIRAFTKDGKPGAFRRWLYVITGYKVLEYWANPKHRVFVTADPPHPIPRPGGSSGCVLNLRILVKLIRSDWGAFWKRYVEKRSAEEVANELGIKSHEVGRAVSRVLKCLRQEDEDGDPVGVLLLRGLLQLIQLDYEDRTFQAFSMVAVGGYSTQAAAVVLGMTDDAVYTAKWKVMKRLKKEFRELGLLPDEGKTMAADSVADKRSEVRS